MGEMQDHVKHYLNYVLALGVLGHQFLRAKSLIYYKLDFAAMSLKISDKFCLNLE